LGYEVLDVKRTVKNEAYFTSAQVAQKCVDFVDRAFQLSAFDVIVEPSAGDGAFLKLLPEGKRIGVDVAPQIAEVVEADFLQWKPSTSGRVLTIGNPPFGARASLAVKFMEKAAIFSEVIAFILPMSFNKYTFRNRVPLNFHLVDSMNISDEFSLDGQDVAINTVFQIWEKRHELRTKEIGARTHPDFDMRHAHLSRVTPQQLQELHTYDFAIAQVGNNFAPRNPVEISKGSYWFIRATVPGVRERFALLDFAFLDGMNLAHKSLSKADIIAAYQNVVRTES
jgi:hypothetical protein